MANKSNYDRAREYLEDIARTADSYHVACRILEEGGAAWRSDIMYERKREYEEALKKAEETIGQMDSREGYALICRYVYLYNDAKMMRTFGYSRSGMYKMLERGVRQLYDYLPDDYLNPRNARRAS